MPQKEEECLSQGTQVRQESSINAFSGEVLISRPTLAIPKLTCSGCGACLPPVPDTHRTMRIHVFSNTGLQRRFCSFSVHPSPNLGAQPLSPLLIPLSILPSPLRQAAPPRVSQIQVSGTAVQLKGLSSFQSALFSSPPTSSQSASSF